MLATTNFYVDISHAGINLKTLPLENFQIFPYYAILKRDIIDHEKPTTIDLAQILPFKVSRTDWIITALEILLNYTDYENKWNRSLTDPRPYKVIIDALSDFFMVEVDFTTMFDSWIQESVKKTNIDIKHGRKVICTYSLSSFEQFPCYQHILKDVMDGVNVSINLQSHVPFKPKIICAAISIVMNYQCYKKYYTPPCDIKGCVYTPYVKALVTLFLVTDDVDHIMASWLKHRY